MADLNGAECGQSPGDCLIGGSRSRGQLLLAGAFVIGLLLVALALLLNSAIFTENLTARGSAQDSGHTAVQLRADAKTVATESVVNANIRHNSSHETLQRNLSSRIRAWNELNGRHEAVAGGLLNLSVSDTTNGTYVRQRTADRNLSSASGFGNWTVVSGAETPREYRLDIDPESLVDPEGNRSVENLTEAGVFHVNVSGPSESRQVFVYRNRTDEVAVTATAANGTLNSSCVGTSTADLVEVDLLNASVGDQACSPLSFFETMSAIDYVRHEHSENAEGTYTLVVDGDGAVVSGSSFNDPDAGVGPYASERINAAVFRLTYETNRLSYRTSIVVVPGDIDD